MPMTLSKSCWNVELAFETGTVTSLATNLWQGGVFGFQLSVCLPLLGGTRCGYTGRP